MPRRTKEDAQKTRQAILLAARILIAEQGFNATSLDQIARHAGVTRGAVYWHFKNKIDVFDAILQEWLAPIHALSQRWLIDEAPDLENLRQFLVQWLMQIERTPHIYELFTILYFKVEYIGEIKAIIDRANQQAADDENALRVYLGSLKQNGQVSAQVDIALFAISISAFLLGTAQHWLSRPASYSIAENAEGLVNQFLRAYQSPVTSIGVREETHV